MYHRARAMPKNQETTPPAPQETTRLAPSPTGALHLGNARTFLVNWTLARQRGWRIILRIEDLDGPRIKSGAIDACIGTLHWLGMDWDEGPIIQSREVDPHVAAMETLARRGRVYPCELTRSQIEQAASAPHAPDPDAPGAEARFPAELRPDDVGPRGFDDTGTNWRFAAPGGEVGFLDAFVGHVTQTPAQTVGDFVVWTKRRLPAYQLAVVVDDHRQGVTQVVRGDDLLDSAARQLLLYRALGYTPEPAHTHLPLVVGPDGRRLAKRHGDTRLTAYREDGIPAERVLGLLAWWSGVAPSRAPISAAEFCSGFDLASMPRRQVTFTPEDDRWLRDGSHLSDSCSC